MRTLRTALVGLASLALVVTALPVVAGSAGAATTLTVRETGRAYYEGDGDTFWMCLTGRSCSPGDVEPGNADVKAVRLMSVQAMELPHEGDLPSEAVQNGVPAVTTPQCHADDARRALNTLLFGTAEPGDAALGREVRLRSQKASSSSYGRLRRAVDVKISGAWVNVEAELLKAGHVMWMPLPSASGEWALNGSHRLLSTAAATAGKGLWDTDACGSGPTQTASIVLDVKWDADGDDLTNVNGEYVRVRNTGSVAVDLKGWTVRTAGWDTYTWRTSTVLQPRTSVVVHSGRAPSKVSAGHYYVGSPDPFLQNVDNSKGIGGGMYLLDPKGDFRSWAVYPSSVKPKGSGYLKISTVVYDPAGVDNANLNGEYVKIKNFGPVTVSLAPLLLQEGGQQLSFSTTSTIGPGKYVTVRIGKGSSTATTKYWQNSTSILANSGGAVRLVSFGGATISCKSWLSGRC